jgi:hypothetical protein
MIKKKIIDYKSIKSLFLFILTPIINFFFEYFKKLIKLLLVFINKLDDFIYFPIQNCMFLFFNIYEIIYQFIIYVYHKKRNKKQLRENEYIKDIRQAKIIFIVWILGIIIESFIIYSVLNILANMFFLLVYKFFSFLLQFIKYIKNY